MKRLFIIALTLCVVSAGLIWAGNENGSPDPEMSAQSSGTRLYSNSYDGYTNIRNAPSSKGQILGRLNNGDDFVVLISMVDNWCKVNYNGNVGYVHRNYVSSSPSKPVTSGVDANWLNGLWCGDGGYSYYFIFSNGRYCLHSQYNEVCYGRWHLEYDTIVLTRKYIVDHELESSAVERMHINKSARTIDNMTKWRLPEDLEEGEDGFTRSYFNFVKKDVAKYVK